MIERLLIVGGSVRAAVMSARRAGFEPIAIDRFADADLQEVCPAFQRYDELRQLPKLARQMPAADWMYTGPLENRHRLVERLAKQRILLGNDRATLRKLRDPWCVAGALARAGLQAPELIAAPEVATGKDWLRKPLWAAGGFGIERFGLGESGRVGHGGLMYFQKFIPGRSIGATFLGASGRAVLVGVTEQLLGPAWGGSREFQYVGSVGPVALSPEHARSLTQIGDCLAERFSVRGLFGVDAIVNDEGVWPVEVNPRYTASVEILERALNFAAIRWHVEACRSGELPESGSATAPKDGLDQFAKAIVYATCEFAVDASVKRELCERNGEAQDPLVADIPTVGTSVGVGEPIVTVFAKGRTTADVKEGLRTAIADVQQLSNASQRRA